MRDKLNIKIIFLDIEPSNSIVEWENLWETANNIPCGITDDGLYYVIVDYMVWPKIVNRAFYEIVMAIKDFCIRDSSPTTDCPKMELYCDVQGRFYADIDKEKPLVLFSIGFYNSHESCLDIDLEIIKSLKFYAYTNTFMETTKEYVTQYDMFLFHSVNNVLVNDILYKIFSLKILEFNAINNSSLYIERFTITNNFIGYQIKDEENLKHILRFYLPNPNIEYD